MSELNITCPDWYQAVLQPSTVQPPCGENLEYDTDFIMLQGRLQPRLGAEYGDFVEAVEPLNWSEVERDAQTLLLRSKDIRLVITLMRCRLRQIGIAAVCEGLEALLCMLEQWPDAVHPQLLDEGEFAPELRANALAELEANDAFLADFRQQMLPRATGLQLSVRDVERAYASPREENAPSELTMSAMQQAWREEPAIASLQLAATRLQQLKMLLNDSLGEDAPELQRLSTLCALFGSAPLVEISAPASEPVISSAMAPAVSEVNAPADATADTLAVVATTVVSSAAPQALQTPQNVVRETIGSRTDALNRLREVRAWFDHVEPSSPVISLLAFTEKTIGKSFVELLQFLPAELIAKLETGQESS